MTFLAQKRIFYYILNDMDNKNKICVYAICKNEEIHVDAWVDSMSEADSIVVLDTGSEDRTVELLEKRGVKVSVKKIDPWRFDVARNESMKLVPEDCNILVCTDLDEVFEPGWANVVRENWVNGKSHMGWFKYAWSHDDNGNDGHVYEFNKIHDRCFKWAYPVHECLVVNEECKEMVLADSNVFFDERVKLHHWPTFKESRNNYMGLLKVRLEENKDDLMSYIYLAREYTFYEKYKECIDICEDALKKFADSSEKALLSYCEILAGESCEKLKDNDKAKSHYVKAIAICPEYRDPYFNLGKMYYFESNFINAKTCFEAGLLKTERHYWWHENGDAFGYQYYDLLSFAQYQLGFKKDSLVSAFKAYSLNPEDERLKQNINFFKETITDKEIVS